MPNLTVTAKAKNANTVTLTVGTEKVDIPLGNATDAIRELLAARKSAYAIKRGKRDQAVKRTTAQRAEKLRAELAKLEAALA